MAKYIEREKAFELVTDLAGQASTKSAYSAFWKAANALKEIPTADVVEVVRCKDCKWYQEGNLLAPNKFCFRLEHPTEDRKIGYNYAPDDFCSYGEKRSEGNGKM